MGKTIIITDGNGTKCVEDGSYDVTANVAGYDNSTLNPEQLNIIDGVDEYELTIGATGTLTIDLVEAGAGNNTPIEGAKFIRCDSDGNPYGPEIETDAQGQASFNNVPYGMGGSTIYFKQTSTPECYKIIPELLQLQMISPTKTIELENEKVATKIFYLTDANYPELPIENGTLNLL